MLRVIPLGFRAYSELNYRTVKNDLVPSLDFTDIETKNILCRVSSLS